MDEDEDEIILFEPSKLNKNAAQPTPPRGALPTGRKKQIGRSTRSAVQPSSQQSPNPRERKQLRSSSRDDGVSLIPASTSKSTRYSRRIKLQKHVSLSDDEQEIPSSTRPHSDPLDKSFEKNLNIENSSDESWERDNMKDLSWNVPPIPDSPDNPPPSPTSHLRKGNTSERMSVSPAPIKPGRSGHDNKKGPTTNFETTRDYDDNEDQNAHVEQGVSYMHIDNRTEDLKEPSNDQSQSFLDALETQQKGTPPQNISVLSKISKIPAELESTQILRDLKQLEAEDEDLDKTNSFDFETELSEFDKHIEELRESKNYLRRREKQREAERDKANELNKPHLHTAEGTPLRKIKNKDKYDRRYSYMRGPPGHTPRKLADSSWLEDEPSLAVRSRTQTMDDMSGNDHDGSDDINTETNNNDVLEDYESDNERLENSERNVVSEENRNNQTTEHKRVFEDSADQSHSSVQEPKLPQEVVDPLSNNIESDQKRVSPQPQLDEILQDHHLPPAIATGETARLPVASMNQNVDNEVPVHVKQEPSLPDIEVSAHTEESIAQKSVEPSLDQSSDHPIQEPQTSQKQPSPQTQRNQAHHSIPEQSEVHSHRDHASTTLDLQEKRDLLRHVDRVLAPNNEAIVEVYSKDPEVATRASNILQLLNSYIETGEHPQLTYEEKMQKAEKEVKAVMPHLFTQKSFSKTAPSAAISRQSTDVFSPQLSTKLPSAPDFRKKLTPEWGRDNWKALEKTFNKCKNEGVEDVETIVSEFLDEWGITHKKAVGDLNPDKIFNRVRALEIKEVERRKRRLMRRSQSRRSMSLATSRATFSPSESLMNADYTNAPKYTSIYPQNRLQKSQTNTPSSGNKTSTHKTPLTRLNNEHSRQTPSSLQKLMNFGLNPLKNLFNDQNKLKPVMESSKDETDRSVSDESRSIGDQSRSMSDHSINTSSTGASIWREDKHKLRGIPPRRLDNNPSISGIIRTRSTPLSSMHQTVRGMQGNDKRSNDTHEHKRHKQSPRRSISRRLSNTSQRSSSLRNDVTQDVLDNSLLK
ncbi:hypothetical protein E3Q23_02656 [Wallemia mellicola]|uniref:Uncharacterized protein n=1 Tax=Wallemia mellicola TaxID=1708541 RepID=A0A4T0PM82_9BASI|nr:hypothetical protein E3Q23_02656 [Wallemia mellicola]TIC04288.1 hypothetical protein E3Q16_02758 [Wallemia mellicola]TIC11079.1 hypothetical protein E3Q15_02814 [Wallemia mellicola]TIC12081.1 hypothetical protein E3Q14_02000 [Wallemia mellicola]TIC64194.1 hypothetical protein E3Q01_02902 [Wallemia mellicola]